MLGVSKFYDFDIMLTDFVDFVFINISQSSSSRMVLDFAGFVIAIIPLFIFQARQVLERLRCSY